MKRILILGKRGQVGDEFASLYFSQPQVTAWDRTDLDLGDKAAIQRRLRELKPDVVINAAAYTAVDDAEADARLAMAINGEAPGVIAQELNAWRGTLVHFSTDYVFDGTKASPYCEDDAPAPLSVYGKSKLEGERSIAAAAHSFLIIRTSWVYGASGHNFCRAVWQWARQREELRIADDQTGSPTWAATAARVTKEIIGRHGSQLEDVRDIVHLAGNGAATRHALACETVRLLRGRYGDNAARARRIVPVSSDEFKTPALRPRYSALSCEKLRTQYGIELPPWQHDLAKFVLEAPDAVWM